MKSRKIIFYSAVLLLAGYLAGALSTKLNLPPVAWIIKYLAKKNVAAKKQDILLSYFTTPVEQSHQPLRHKAVQSLAELKVHIDALAYPVDSFETAYSHVKIISAITEGEIAAVAFEYNKHIDTAFAFFRKRIGYNDNTSAAFNIIPGSGINQSTAMYYDIAGNYQMNIDNIAEKYGDVYILVKPNEDFLAIHNGSKKVDVTAFVNYLLNKGSSYSACYMIQSLALSKYLQSKYEKLYVCGLSQGGGAALMNALQSQPYKAIVASGFSVLMDYPHLNAHDQIIIPGYMRGFDINEIKSQIQQSATRYLFTWGQQESGIYGLEARDKPTAAFFDGIKNVNTIVHPMAHMYFEPLIDSFIRIP
jgi:hypothetical protein